MILVPVKNLAEAKQRLRPLLYQSACTELAQAMLCDVLQTLSAWPHRPEVSLVTSDPFAHQLAQQFHLSVIIDNTNHSETDAIDMATRVCESRGVESTMVIPGDIPLVQTWELERILQTAPAEGSVLVPAADGRGTNAVLRQPAGLFPLRFGNDSFQPHLAAARATQKTCVVLNLPGIAFDIDRPQDLYQLAAIAGQTRSQRLLREWKITEWPLAVNE